MSLEKNAYESIVKNLHDGLYFVDKNRVITFWNKAAERISGFTASEVVGKSCKDNILTHIDCNGHNLCTGNCPLVATMESGNPCETNIYMHHKDGHRIPVSVRVSALRDEEGQVVGGIELFTDISNQAAHELRVKELEKLAYLDHLTQLANRPYVEKEIQNRFDEMQRLSIPFGVLFIDIDNFKTFNDTYGHDLGDQVIQYVSKTLVANSRPFDLYGRWGGEEFVCVIRNIEHEQLEVLGNRIRTLIEKSYVMHGPEKLSVTISLGATSALKSDTMESLIKRADTLLYQSKAAGRNCLTLG